MPGEILVAGAVRGLVSEGGRIARIIDDVAPGAIGLAVSKEGLSAMWALKEKNTHKSEPTNTEERVYMKGLEAFGEVVKPPPCFTAALDVGIPLTALDMDDEHYTAAYCRYVSTWDVMRQGRNQKSMLRHKFKAASPREFVLEWDRMVNRLDGYKALEASREIWLAKGACRMTEKYQNILVVVEYERLRGVLKYLDKLGCKHRVIE